MTAADRAVLWFRRDLRLRDHPALHAAADDGEVLGLFVIDPVLWRSAGTGRRAMLAASLRALDASMGGRLCVRRGKPEEVVPQVVAEARAVRLHVTNDSNPYARVRDAAVVAALPEGVTGVATGTPYAVAPGTLLTGAGAPFQVFTPFARAWRQHGWEAPLPVPDRLAWASLPSEEGVDDLLDEAIAAAPAGMPAPGEDAARDRFSAFLDADVDDYADARNLPGVDRTSRMSAYLKYGVVHPRQLLAETATRRTDGATTFEKELAWRDFYADVLLHHPESAWRDLRPVPGVTYDDPAEAVEAWRTGTTGFPMVDAGMRQLLSEGWMHNRVRMITASFLTKDLHAWWGVGARHFLDHLVDGDLASNNHGWQWVAGTGTDPAPYFRVFNPVTQGLKFDPDGDYVRRWVPELAHLSGKAAHEPWDHPDGYVAGYPQRIVDHAAERREALARYESGRR